MRVVLILLLLTGSANAMEMQDNYTLSPGPDTDAPAFSWEKPNWPFHTYKSSKMSTGSGGGASRPFVGSELDEAFE